MDVGGWFVSVCECVIKSYRISKKTEVMTSKCLKKFMEVTKKGNSTLIIVEMFKMMNTRYSQVRNIQTSQQTDNQFLYLKEEKPQHQL